VSGEGDGVSDETAILGFAPMVVLAAVFAFDMNVLDAQGSLLPAEGVAARTVKYLIYSV
jgi:hypothetical protein